MALTSIERVKAFLNRKPHDRIPTYEHWWDDTLTQWADRSWITEDTDLDEYFDHDIKEQWYLNTMADLDFVPKIITEDEDTYTTLNGNGATLRHHKHHDTTPEHIDFTVKSRAEWEELIKPKLVGAIDHRRINYDAYRKNKRIAAANDRFFCASCINVFESMHPVCGHEYMLMGMALDPDWVKDMANTYADLIIHTSEELFAKEGVPDGMWFYEDMGFKGRPFMSPAMYKEIIQPAHKKTIDYYKSLGLPVIMHSCGYVEPLIPGMIEAGIDCLQVIEVKAGMDLLKLIDQFGEKLSFMGGMDVRKLYTNDETEIERELIAKLPTAMKHNGYALHSDHSIPNTVDITSYEYFLQRGRELGKY